MVLAGAARSAGQGRSTQHKCLSLAPRGHKRQNTTFVRVATTDHNAPNARNSGCVALVAGPRRHRAKPEPAGRAWRPVGHRRAAVRWKTGILDYHQTVRSDALSVGDAMSDEEPILVAAPAPASAPATEKKEPYREAGEMRPLTGDIDVYMRINVFSISVEFDGKPRGVYKIKFYFEACWDDSSPFIEQRDKPATENPINQWDPRIFFPDIEGALNIEKEWIATNLYADKFDNPMMAYRVIGTAEFPAKNRCVKDFPFDHHEIDIVVRSKEAEEQKNKHVTVRFYQNHHAKSDINAAEKHPAYDMFDFAVQKEPGEKPYLGVHMMEEPMAGDMHTGRTMRSFKAVMRIRRRAKDWVIQAVLPVLISAFVCGFSFMPPVCHLADRQQVSLGVLFTLVAFSLGLKALDFYPKVPYFTFIDNLVLLNMLVMVLCVVLNALSYALHGTCNEGDAEFQTRSFTDWILLGIICFTWVLSNLALYFKIIWGRNHLAHPKGVVVTDTSASLSLDADKKATPTLVKGASYRWQVTPAN